MSGRSTDPTFLREQITEAMDILEAGAFMLVPDPDDAERFQGEILAHLAARFTQYFRLYDEHHDMVLVDR